MSLQIIFGIIGNILSLYFGIKIVQTYCKNRLESVIPFNNYLFFIMFFNTFNWMFYAVVLKDMYIFINNIIVLFGNFFMMFVIWEKVTIQRKINIEIMCCMFLSYFIIMIFLLNFTLVSYEKLLFTCGISAVITSIMSYLAPVLIIRDVIQTKNHKLIYIPQVLIGLVSMIIFTIYGFIINNFFIVGVDVVIIFLCLVQLVIYVYYKYIYKNNTDKVNDIQIDIELANKEEVSNENTIVASDKNIIGI